MSNKKVFIVLILSCLISSVTGAAAGFYAALKTPSVSNVAVLDIEELAKTIDPNSPDFIAKTNALSDKTKMITSQLTLAGMVVIDRAHVISAPEEAIIHVVK